MYVTCCNGETPGSHDRINGNRFDLFIKTTMKQGRISETKHFKYETISREL